MATKKYRCSVSQTCIYNLIYWPRSCFYKSVAFIPRLKSWAFSLTFRKNKFGSWNIVIQYESNFIASLHTTDSKRLVQYDFICVCVQSHL